MMAIALIDPASGEALQPQADGSLAAGGVRFEVVNGIPRICEPSNYTDNFGLQWNMFSTTQIDREEAGRRSSEERFFLETGWRPEELEGEALLEVGSGAGRFSRVVLQRTQANLYSVDYSSSVEANLANNGADATTATESSCSASTGCRWTTIGRPTSASSGSSLSTVRTR